MVEQIKSLIGKNCYIYTIQSMSSPIKGTIREVDNNSIVLETKTTNDIINLEYVIRVSEIVNRKKKN